jgi:hypothetical protein
MRSIITSRFFKFVIGEAVDGSPTEFMIHEAAIAQLTDPLNSLFTGLLEEASSGRTVWEDVRKETFEKLVQFAYLGDYETVNPRLRELIAPKESLGGEAGAKAQGDGTILKIVVGDPEDILPPDVPDSQINALSYSGNELLGSGYSRRSKKRKTNATTVPEPAPVSPPPKVPESAPVSPLPPLKDFEKLNYPLVVPTNNREIACQPPTNFLPNHDYSEVLLSHAHLYVLADYWMIDSLKALSSTNSIRRSESLDLMASTPPIFSL